MYVRSNVRFDWDPTKARENLRKHGITFEDARTAFSDDQAILIPDPDHSGEEDRFVLIGLSATLRVLTVVHCYREGDEIVRIVSARRATRYGSSRPRS